MNDAIQVDLLAEESHAGRIWILLILPALIGPLYSLWFSHTPFVIGAAVFVVALAAAISAVMWSGFQYCFLRHGVEVRMLGFRLRSIPRQSIVSYSIETWSLPRGYGIRGRGSMRAFVWCNKVVHIETTNGDIYLGHNDPQRIVRDLDMVTGFSSPG
jgi:hypothetical protein